MIRWRLLLPLLVGVAASAPLFGTPYFASDDGLVHLWRIWEYARTAAEVGPIVRWAPDLAYGYGAPLFSFYNPLAYALGALLMSTGVTAAFAARALFGLSMLLAAVGAFYLAEAWLERAAPAAGLCAALLYTFAPYRIATVYQRGALAEAIGLAVAPWVAFAALRVVERRGVAWIGALALATGGVILAHTIAALMALPFAGLLGLARVAELHHDRRRAFARLCAGLALGVVVGATYLLPAYTQQQSVHLELARWSGEVERFQSGFAWPWQLVQPSLIHDYGHRVDDDQTPLAQRFPRVGGIAFLALAAGAVAGWRGGRLRRPTGLVALATIAGSLALATPAALPLWNRIELLGAVQLGWRFLALVALATIPLSAELGAMAVRPTAGGRPAVPGLAWLGVALALAASLGAVARLPLERIEWSALRERPAELAAYERKDGQFALGALREYVPAWVAATPEELVRLPAPAAEASPATPISARLLAASATQRRYGLDAVTPTVVTLDLFYHPALTATLDGAPISLRPVGDDGLVAFDLPSGAHELAVGPAPTAVELMGLALSAIGVVAALALLLRAPALAWRRARPRAAGGSWRHAAGLPSAGPLGPAHAGSLPFVALAAAVGLAAAWAGGRASPSTPRQLTLVAATPAELPGVARLLGARVDRALVATAGLVTVDLHLESLAAQTENRPLTVWVADATGRRVTEGVAGPAGGLRPTGRWRANELLVARTELRLPAGLPDGIYSLGIESGGTAAQIGGMELPAAGAVPMDELAAPFRRHESIFGSALVLDGYSYDKDPAGQPFRGSFWWRAVGDESSSPDQPGQLEATLRLVDKQGALLASDARPIGGAIPRPEADFALRAPSPLPAESYRLELLVRPSGSRDPLPARTFDGGPTGALVLTWFDVRDPCDCIPPSARPLAQRFADGIALVGLESQRAGDDVDVALYWRADARPSRDYTMFLHALVGDRVVGQVDDQPNAGRRPTGRWMAGEVIRDHYRLKAPGATALRVGFYTPSDGRRLPTDPGTPDSAVTIELPR
jgi:hypothetical protein